MLTLILLLTLAAPESFSLQQGPANAPPSTGASAKPTLDPSVADRIDAYLQAQRKVNRFSGTVLLALGGEAKFVKGYGWANAEWEIPNAANTKFRIGSITKQFTSMVVMQLQETGKLKVQDSICVYLSPCPDTWKPVTVHHLLTHTSGIPSYTGLPDFLKISILPKTPDEMIALFRDLPLEFEPGSSFKYNNSGYFLLGVLIEKVTGRKYEEVLRDQIFTPLGMADSGYDRSDPILPRRAAGYARDGEGMANARYLDMGQPFAAGALYSTVEDLLKWDQALYTDRLLPAAAKTAMFTPFKNNYAYGWTIPTPSPATFGRRQIAHGGNINGFASMFIRLPDDQMTVVVLANNAQSNAGRIARDMLAIALGQPYETPVQRVAIKVDPAIYDAFVGRYELRPDFIMTVTREGDRLMAQATGQQKIEIFPESETKFFAKVLDAQITFVKEGGAVTHLILTQNGQPQRAPRMP
jgi:CubicO group peptidase (beta-lactamase class C family)